MSPTALTTGITCPLRLRQAKDSQLLSGEDKMKGEAELMYGYLNSS